MVRFEETYFISLFFLMCTFWFGLYRPQAKHEQLSADWNIMITSLVLSVIEEETMQAAAQAEVMEGSHESYVLLLGWCVVVIISLLRCMKRDWIMWSTVSTWGHCSM